MISLKAFSSLALSALFLSGCGMATGVANKPVGTQTGSSTINFVIPTRSQGSQFTEFPKNQPGGVRPNVDIARPQFMDSSAFTTSGTALQMYLDRNNVATISFTGLPTVNGNLKPGPGPSAPSTSTPDGGSISYSSVITATEIDVTVNLTTTTDTQHNLGVVQTNGACLPNVTGTTDWCLGGAGTVGEGLPGTNLGYVLAEGQTSFTLNSGSSNPGVSLTLQAVLQSGYICPTPPYAGGCDGTPGTPDGNGWYHITAMPTDENGTTAIPQTAPSQGWNSYLTPYGNGAWQISEVDENHVIDLQPDLTTTGLGPYTTPNPIQRPSGLYWDGQYAKFKCLKTGTATIAMHLYQGASGSTAVHVDGFSYNSPTNYPDTGALLGPVGADVFYGNGRLTVQCTTYGSVAIVVN
jgi:hypothetical protein